MQITIRLLASYRPYLPELHDAQGGFAYEAEPGATVHEVLHSLPIPPTDRSTFFVNGLHGRREQVLRAGDVLTVFPAVGGG